MQTLSCFWQFTGSYVGVPTLRDLKKKLKFPKTALQITEKLNCRSWSLTLQDERNMLSRLMQAQETLSTFSLLPSRIRKLYFFNRKWAKPIFKKRHNNYVSFNMQTNVTLAHWFSTLNMLRDISKVIRNIYDLPTGVIARKNISMVRFTVVNPTMLLGFLKNDKLITKPQILVGFFWVPKSCIFNTNWIWQKLNEAS